MKKKNQLPVIFRMEKNGGEWTPLAVFPTTNESVGCECYSHIGQHSEICRGYYNQDTKPATESEYKPLLKELHFIGYRNLRIVKKWLHKYAE